MNKVTTDHIKSKIKGETYLVLSDGRTTLCQLTLQNGFSVVGTSACVDAANFDMNIGRKIAFENAFEQIWPLEGYLLAEKLYWDAAQPVATNPPKPKSSRLVRSLKRGPTSPDAPWGYKKDGTPRARPGRKVA